MAGCLAEISSPDRAVKRALKADCFNKNTKNTLKNSKTPKSNRELFESKYFKNKIGR